MNREGRPGGKRVGFTELRRGRRSKRSASLAPSAASSIFKSQVWTEHQSAFQPKDSADCKGAFTFLLFYRRVVLHFIQCNEPRQDGLLSLPTRDGLLSFLFHFSLIKLSEKPLTRSLFTLRERHLLPPSGDSISESCLFPVADVGFSGNSACGCGSLATVPLSGNLSLLSGEGTACKNYAQMGKLKSPLGEDAEENDGWPPCAKESCRPTKKQDCAGTRVSPRMLRPQIVILGRSAEGSSSLQCLSSRGQKALFVSFSTNPGFLPIFSWKPAGKQPR